MKIINSVPEDIDHIFRLYDYATEYQKKMAPRHWQGFERSLIEKEISELRQWKIIIDNQIACVFVITFSDADIWKDRNTDPAIYLHRIATHPSFRGRGLVGEIVEWAKAFAKANGKKFIRLDTGSGNEKLNAYYISCGFNYLGVTNVDPAADLPLHYKMGGFSLFEIAL